LLPLEPLLHRAGKSLVEPTSHQILSPRRPRRGDAQPGKTQSGRLPPQSIHERAHAPAVGGILPRSKVICWWLHLEGDRLGL
jgi:hypothetical protein